MVGVRSFGGVHPAAWLIGAGLSMVVALAYVSALHKRERPTIPLSEVPTLVRNIRFEDRPNGFVIVRDAQTNAVVERVEPGTNGFLRASVRGLAQARLHFGGDPQAAFRLSAWPDGRWTLTDPVTGRTLELEAFGPTNLAAFARLAGGRS